MSHIAPSTVVTYIEELFPRTRPHDQERERRFTPGPDDKWKIAQVDALLDRVPDALVFLPPEDFAAYWAERAVLKAALEMWAGPGPRAGGIPATGRGEKPALVELRDLLARCPDSLPPKNVAGMEFIKDAQLRDSLRADLDAAYANWTASIWKGATVLAGSVVEALLLWVVQKEPPQVRQCRNDAAPTGGTDPLRWSLEKLIKTAEASSLIDGDTARAASLAQEYRNLIHPGRAQRLSAACTRATAMFALGAAERVAEDLANR